MMNKIPDETLVEIEQAQAALRDSFERAKELICEAKLMMRQQRAAQRKPNPERGNSS